MLPYQLQKQSFKNIIELDVWSRQNDNQFNGVQGRPRPDHSREHASSRRQMLTAPGPPARARFPFQFLL